MKAVENHWKNGIIGVAVGDVLGTPVQFLSREEIANRKQGPVRDMEGHGTFDMPAGTWSDDTSLSLAEVFSILDKRMIDPDDMMKRFVEWEEEGKYTPYGFSFDEGKACAQSISAYKGGADIVHCGKTGEHANGNGALMRILPVCLFYVQNDVPEQEALKGIYEVTALTHNHMRAKIASGIYYFLVKNLILNKDEALSLKEVLQLGMKEAFAHYEETKGYDQPEVKEQLQFYARLADLEDFAKLSEKEIQSTGYVVHSLEAAIWSLLKGRDFSDILLTAVNLGDDTDSVAAIAGGLAGLYYGYDQIPENWVKQIKKIEWMEEICELASKYAGSKG